MRHFKPETPNTDDRPTGTSGPQPIVNFICEEEPEPREIIPGETDERGHCLMNCGRVWHRSLWCWPCSFENTGEP